MIVVTIQSIHNESVTQSVAVRKYAPGKPDVIAAAESASREALNRFEDRILGRDEVYEPESI